MLETRPLFRLSAQVAAPQTVAGGPYGERRFIAVTGGSFSGERISGQVLSGGADCQLIRPDGVAELDVRVTLEADDGAIILMKGLGIRHASSDVMRRIASGERVDRTEYYFRESILFEAPDGPHAWLNRLIAVGMGERLADEVLIDVFEIL